MTIQFQPPLGGCVLKLFAFGDVRHVAGPAAFRRLCVETLNQQTSLYLAFQPPLGGCVLKQHRQPLQFQQKTQPPLGGCVLKQNG